MKFTTAAALNRFLVRDPDNDFRDDGTSYKMYRYGEGKFALPISFASNQKYVYLYIRYPEQIPCDFILNKFSNEWYPLAEKFNGMLKADPELTAENIADAVRKAYDLVCKRIGPEWEAERETAMSDENIEKLRLKRAARADELEAELKKVQESTFTLNELFNAGSYDINRLRDYIHSLTSTIARLREFKPCWATYGEVLRHVVHDKPITEGDFWIKSIDEILSKIHS